MVETLLMGLFGWGAPEVPMPSVPETQALIEKFQDEYGTNLQVRVQILNLENPSPLLTRGSFKRCTIYINQHESARNMWGHLAGHSKAPREAFLTYAVGHEMAHCIAALPAQRQLLRHKLEDAAGMRFANSHHFEESLGDLSGLHFLEQTHPEHWKPVSERVADLREQLAQADPNHDSRQLLSKTTLSLAESLIRQHLQIQVANKKSAPEGAL